MLGNALDRLIAVFSPQRAVARMQARQSLQAIQQFFGTGQGGYDAGKHNRLTAHRGTASQSENAIPREQVGRLRAASWNLFRNNPHARKICRSLESKVVGRNPQPASQASRRDGTPFVEFRERALELWQAVSGTIDYRGKPWQGGLHLADLHRQALRSVILDGELLFRFRTVSPAKAEALGLPVPFRVQLIHAERLDESIVSDNVLFGVELNDDGERLAYHVRNRHPSDPRGWDMGSKRVPAAEIGHLFVQDDVDQLRGVPWFSAALLKLRDVGDYEFNELTAAAMAACVALGVRMPTGASKFGVNAPGNAPLTDAAGNPITGLSPGMIFNLGSDGALEAFNPGRPNNGAADFIDHMIRSTASGLPGIKASSLTGDYRRSSFASERSADNDVWPELECLQDWFFAGFSQPIYEKLIEAGAVSGWFDDLPGFSLADFAARRDEYLSAHWQGPVARSINPVDDAEAASKRIANGTSSPQREAALLGRDWRQIVREAVEYLEYAKGEGLPLDIAEQVLGIQQIDHPDQETASESAADEPAGGDFGEEDDVEEIDPDATAAAAA